LADAGLEAIEIRQNDRVWSLVPPYQSAFERAQVQEAIDDAARGVGLWDEATTRRYFVAGGGAAPDFAHRWQAALEQNERWVDAIRRKEYAATGGGLFYLACGRRPLAAE
jgi:hypothetical protein